MKVLSFIYFILIQFLSWFFNLLWLNVFLSECNMWWILHVEFKDNDLSLYDSKVLRRTPLCASSSLSFWFISCSQDKKRSPEKLDMDSDQRLSRHGQHCHHKAENSRLRHLHQSTLSLGDAAPCYTTTHTQVSDHRTSSATSHTWSDAFISVLTQKRHLVVELAVSNLWDGQQGLRCVHWLVYVLYCFITLFCTFPLGVIV